MYLKFYNLEKEPFHITPNPAFLYSSPSHKEALAVITYGVDQRKGFIAIFGEVGLGKTTIIRSYLEQADKQALKTIYILNPDVSFRGLLKAIYLELEIVPESDDLSEMVNQLYLVLIAEYKQGHTVVLIIDEAQNLPIETLENLRLLSNLETPEDKLIQIVFVGQPELEEKLNLNELRQLNQRIVMRAHIMPFSRRQSVAYIQHRLSKAGRNDIAVFTNAALRRIITRAQGNPRIINILCGNALATGFGYQEEQISARTAKEVIADFEGKKKTDYLIWLISTVSLALITVGIWWISPHSDQVLSKVREIFTAQSPEPSITRSETITVPEQVKASPMKIEVEPPTEKETSKTVASTEPVKAPPMETDVARPAEKTASKSDKSTFQLGKTTFPVKRVVKKGDTLYSLVREVYGVSNKELIARVKKQNKRIGKNDKIESGQKLIFPAPAKTRQLRG
ncbi:MAG: AAA family ATPase [Dissulfurispiraceae bacterium]